MEEKVIIKSEQENVKGVAIFIGGVIFALWMAYILVMLMIGGTNFSIKESGNQIFYAIVLVTTFVPAWIYYIFMSKMELTVTDKRVYGTVNWGKRVDLPVDKISAISSCGQGGVAITTPSGAIKFLMLKNRDEVYKALNTLLMNRQSQPTAPVAATTIKQAVPLSNADELKKFKELLDQDIITQEEFNQKKKELLGL